MSISKGGSINVSVSVWNDEYPEGIGYDDFDIHVAEDEIDEYLVYRLIEPSYIEFRQLGIYQRNLTDFEETAIVSLPIPLTTFSSTSEGPTEVLYCTMRENTGR